MDPITLATVTLGVIQRVYDARRNMKENRGQKATLSSRVLALAPHLEDIRSGVRQLSNSVELQALQNLSTQITRAEKLVGVFGEKTVRRKLDRFVRHKTWSQDFADVNAGLSQAIGDLNFVFLGSADQRRNEDIEDARLAISELISQATKDFREDNEATEDNLRKLQEQVAEQHRAVIDAIIATNNYPLPTECTDVDADASALSELCRSEFSTLGVKIDGLAEVLHKILDGQKSADTAKVRQLQLAELRLREEEIAIDTSVELGQGGYGIVYKGVYNSTSVAVKMVKPLSGTSKLNSADKECIENELIVSRFLCNNPNILRVYGFVHSTKYSLMVLELAPYGDLWSGMLHDDETFPTIPLSLSLSWLLDLASAAKHLLVKGVRHRDVKSENLLLYGDPNRLKVRLCDFGFAKMTSVTTSASSTGVGGTSNFRAPESLRTGQSSFKSDIFAVGMTAVQVLTRRQPQQDDWSGQVARALAVFPDINEASALLVATVKSIFQRTVEPEPRDRPDAIQLHAELEAIVQLAGGDPRLVASAPDYESVAEIEDRARTKASRHPAVSDKDPNPSSSSSSSSSITATSATTTNIPTAFDDDDIAAIASLESWLRQAVGIRRNARLWAEALYSNSAEDPSKIGRRVSRDAGWLKSLAVSDDVEAEDIEEALRKGGFVAAGGAGGYVPGAIPPQPTPAPAPAPSPSDHESRLAEVEEEEEDEGQARGAQQMAEEERERDRERERAVEAEQAKRLAAKSAEFEAERRRLQLQREQLQQQEERLRVDKEEKRRAEAEARAKLVKDLAENKAKAEAEAAARAEAVAVARADAKKKTEADAVARAKVAAELEAATRRGRAEAEEARRLDKEKREAEAEELRRVEKERAEAAEAAERESDKLRQATAVAEAKRKREQEAAAALAAVEAEAERQRRAKREQQERINKQVPLELSEMERQGQLHREREVSWQKQAQELGAELDNLASEISRVRKQYTAGEKEACSQKRPSLGVLRTHTGGAIYRCAEKGDLVALQALAQEWFAHDDALNWKTWPSSWTALIAASRNGHAGVVKLLAGLPGMALGQSTKSGKTACYKAARWGHPSVLKILAAATGTGVNTANNAGWTPLLSAASSGHLECVRILAAVNGADVNKANKYQWTPLYAAASIGNVAIVELLSAVPGVDVNAGPNGRSPLWIAASLGFSSVVRILCANPGVTISKVDTERRCTALMVASTDSVRAILTAARDRFSEGVAGAGSLLLEAADAGDVDQLAALVLQYSGNEAVLNFANAANGRTACWIACHKGHGDCVRVLARTRGVDQNKPDLFGWTPLYTAAYAGHASCVEVLARSPGVSINQVSTSFHETALYVASRWGRTDCVKILATHASVLLNLPAKDGSTPLSVADDDEIKTILRKQGAKLSL